MNDNILEVRNLTKHYDDFTLTDVNLFVPKGCIVGLVGENGAGKSTTLKAILNLVRMDSGDIEILGKDYRDASLKDEVGVVFDDCNFPEIMNAKEVNLVFRKIYPKWNSEKYFDYLKRFDIPLKKTIKEYSRGMRMKLSLAVAFSHSAKLLILDEATSGLDPIVREDILDAFLEFIQDEECGILISSHILSDLEKACDYISFIHKGKVVFFEEKDRLIEEYGVIKCSKEEFQKLDSSLVEYYRENSFGVEVLVKRENADSRYTIDHANVEDIMLFSIKGKKGESICQD